MHAFESLKTWVAVVLKYLSPFLSYLRLLKIDNLKWAVVPVFMVCANQKLAGSILSPEVQDCVKSIQPIAIQHDRAFMTPNPHMLHTCTVSTYHARAYGHLILMQLPISHYFTYSWCQVKLYCSPEVFHSRYFLCSPLFYVQKQIELIDWIICGIRCAIPSFRTHGL